MTAARRVDVAIAGKYCETGDILIQHVDLHADPKIGDLVADPHRGRISPAPWRATTTWRASSERSSSWVRTVGARIVRRRETYEDLTARDVR